MACASRWPTQSLTPPAFGGISVTCPRHVRDSDMAFLNYPPWKPFPFSSTTSPHSHSAIRTQTQPASILALNSQMSLARALSPRLSDLHFRTKRSVRRGKPPPTLTFLSRNSPRFHLLRLPPQLPNPKVLLSLLASFACRLASRMLY